jgi:hypothetical protein
MPLTGSETLRVSELHTAAGGVCLRHDSVDGLVGLHEGNPILRYFLIPKVSSYAAADNKQHDHHCFGVG